MPTRLHLPILAQPDDVTCGPTCLHAVYRYWGDDVPIGRVVSEVAALATRGTLAVLLGNHALARGYRATIHSCDLAVLDPTWFDPGGDVSGKLAAQRTAKEDPRVRTASDAYLEFLERGGELRFDGVDRRLIRGFLRAGTPILTGLSATYLYGCAREVDDGGRLRYDDVRGEPTGHFVVLHGWDPGTQAVWVADPLHENPGWGGSHYAAPVERLLAAIFLGALTFDANLLVVRPPGEGAAPEPDDGEEPGR